MASTSKWITESLAHERAQRLAASRALWRMTAAQRRAAMREGKLSGQQLCEWARMRTVGGPIDRR